jgi:histidine ammonia-lyase
MTTKHRTFNPDFKAQAVLAVSSGNFHGEPLAQVSENKTLAHPDVVDSIPTSSNQEDFNPMAMAAQQIIRREVAYLEHDRLIMDDARKMVELVRKGEIVAVLGSTGD